MVTPPAALTARGLFLIYLMGHFRGGIGRHGYVRYVKRATASQSAITAATSFAISPSTGRRTGSISPNDIATGIRSTSTLAIPSFVIQASATCAPFSKRVPGMCFESMNNSAEGSRDLWRQFVEGANQRVEGLVFVDVYETVEDEERVKMRCIPSVVRLMPLYGQSERVGREVSKPTGSKTSFASALSADRKVGSRLPLNRQVIRPLGVSSDDLPRYVVEGAAKIGEYISERKADRYRREIGFFNLKLEMSRRASVVGDVNAPERHHIGVSFEPASDFCVQRLQVCMRPVELVPRAGEIRDRVQVGATSP